MKNQKKIDKIINSSSVIIKIERVFLDKYSTEDFVKRIIRSHSDNTQ